jgi:hypothetical protein
MPQGPLYRLRKCPFGTENWVYSVELVESDEAVDSEDGQ